MRTAVILTGVAALAAAAPAVVSPKDAVTGVPINGGQDGDWHIGCDADAKDHTKDKCSYYQGAAEVKFTTFASEYEPTRTLPKYQPTVHVSPSVSVEKRQLTSSSVGFVPQVYPITQIGDGQIQAPSVLGPVPKSTRSTSATPPVHASSSKGFVVVPVPKSTRSTSKTPSTPTSHAVTSSTRTSTSRSATSSRTTSSAKPTSSASLSPSRPEPSSTGSPMCSFSEEECVDCEEYPELCDSCNFVYECSKKVQCSYFGFFEMMTFCGEKIEECSEFDDESNDESDDEFEPPSDSSTSTVTKTSTAIVTKTVTPYTRASPVKPSPTTRRSTSVKPSASISAHVSSKPTVSTTRLATSTTTLVSSKPTISTSTRVILSSRSTSSRPVASTSTLFVSMPVSSTRIFTAPGSSTRSSTTSSSVSTHIVPAPVFSTRSSTPSRPAASTTMPVSSSRVSSTDSRPQRPSGLSGDLQRPTITPASSTASRPQRPSDQSGDPERPIYITPEVSTATVVVGTTAASTSTR